MQASVLSCSWARCCAPAAAGRAGSSFHRQIVHAPVLRPGSPNSPLLRAHATQQQPQQSDSQPSASQPTAASSLSAAAEGALPPGACRTCQGTGRVACSACLGTGQLPRGGYNKKNPVPKDPVNSKWTAMEETVGWRHFRVLEQRKRGTLIFLLMQASCDPSAQLWVNRDALRDRSRWAAGWLQMSEVMGPSQSDSTASSSTSSGTSAANNRPCRSCSGTGIQICSVCDASGIRLINI